MKCAQFSLRVFVPDFKIGGGEKLAKQFLSEIKPGIDFRDIEVYSEQSLNIAGIKVKKVTNWRLGFLWPFMFSAGSIRFIYLSGPMMLYGAFSRGGAVLYEHGDPFKLLGLSNSKIRRILYKRALKKCSRLVVVNENVKSKIVGHFEIDPLKVAVVGNPVIPITEHKCFKLDPEEMFEFKKSIIIGRSSPEKNIESGVSKLKEKFPDKSIVVVSNFNENFFGDCVKVISSYSDLEEINVKHTVLFNFSTVETFSLVIGEWLASGGVVCSIECPILKSIWGGCYGFFEFSQVDSLQRLVQSDERPVYRAQSTFEYIGNVRDILYESVNAWKVSARI